MVTYHFWLQSTHIWYRCFSGYTKLGYSDVSCDSMSYNRPFSSAWMSTCNFFPPSVCFRNVFPTFSFLVFSPHTFQKTLLSTVINAWSLQENMKDYFIFHHCSYLERWRSVMETIVFTFGWSVSRFLNVWLTPLSCHAYFVLDGCHRACSVLNIL